jgi:hypothetical protein
MIQKIKGTKTKEQTEIGVLAWVLLNIFSSTCLQERAARKEEA